MSLIYLTNAAIPTCEAMICGLTVAAFDVGDTAALLGNGSRGRLVQDGDVAALAAATAELLGDDSSRRALSEAAREHAEHHFRGWPERVGMEFSIIKAIVDNRHSPTARSAQS